QNTTISNNQNGVYITGGTSISIINSTIVENADYGLSLYLLPTTNAIIRGSILSNNPKGSSFLRGTLRSEGYNIFDLTNPFPKSSVFDKGVFQAHPTDLLGVDPKISPLIDNAFHALPASS